MKNIIKILPILMLFWVVSVKAVSAAPRLTLNPNSGDKNKNEEFQVRLGAQSEGKKIAGLDAIMNYDSTRLELIEKPSLITAGNFDLYSSTTDGKITISMVQKTTGGALDVPALTGDYVVMKFKTKDLLGTARISFVCTASSLTDSNLLTNENNTVLDVISCSDNQQASYEIKEGGSGGNTAAATSTPIVQSTKKAELPKTGSTGATIGLTLLGIIGMAGAFLLKAL